MVRSIGHLIWSPGKQLLMGKLPELIKIQKEIDYATVTVSTSQAAANPGLRNFLAWPSSKATEHCS